MLTLDMDTETSLVHSPKDAVRWSWDRRATPVARAWDNCNPLRWSPASDMDGALRSLERTVSWVPRTASRPVLLRIGDVDVAFERLDLAVSAIKELCRDSGGKEASDCPGTGTCVCATALSHTSTCIGSHVDASHNASMDEGFPKDDVVCAICLEDVAGTAGNACWELPCSHTFHAVCMHRWLQFGSSCPACRCGLVGKMVQHCAS